MPAPRAPEREIDEPLAMTWSVGRVLAVVVALAMVVFWIWIFSGGPKRANPDRLDDRAFVERTHERCQALRDDLAELPNAQFIDDAADRADVLDDANDLVRAMVDAIEADAPTSGDDEISVGGWIADWRTYVADREAYATELRTDPAAQMAVSENEELRDGVDKTIEVFADVNDMPDCATPGDVG